MNNKYSKKFNFPKDLWTSFAAPPDDWRELQIMSGDLYSTNFFISDDGDVFVEFLAYGFDANMEVRYQEIHLPLLELKNIIAEVEQIASVTFDDEGNEIRKNEEE